MRDLPVLFACGRFTTAHGWIWHMLPMVIATASCRDAIAGAIREIAAQFSSDACAGFVNRFRGRQDREGRLNGAGQKCRPRDNSSRSGPVVCGSRMARLNIRTGLE